MKANKIITLGLVAASAGLIMGTVALPAQAASVDRMANVQPINRPDSGGDGGALNHLLRQFKITASAPGEYKVTVRDNGLPRWLSILGDSNLGSGASRNCTPGYSPCLPRASDYDCRGGSGDGPKYTGPVRVTGSDPYNLDRDHDGTGCERS